jgi:hypothetical protein
MKSQEFNEHNKSIKLEETHYLSISKLNAEEISISSKGWGNNLPFPPSILQIKDLASESITYNTTGEFRYILFNYIWVAFAFLVVFIWGDASSNDILKMLIILTGIWVPFLIFMSKILLKITLGLKLTDAES